RISSHQWNNARIWLILNTKVYAILLMHKKAIANIKSIPIKSVVDKDYGISLDQRTHLRAELNVRIMSRVDGTRLLSSIVLFRAIAEDGDTICVQQLVHLMVTKVKRKQWLADMHQRKQRRLSMQRWLRTFRNAPDLGWCLRIPLVIEKPQLVAINNRTLSLQNATGQLGMSADQLRGRLNANGIGLCGPYNTSRFIPKTDFVCVLSAPELTDGIVPNTLVIADCNFDKFAIPDHISQVNSSTRKAAPQFFKVVKTIRHPGEVKRITEFPQYQRIVATHTDSPKVIDVYPCIIF
nr:hypothetical protein [Tanacetum cinerariifolium]